MEEVLKTAGKNAKWYSLGKTAERATVRRDFEFQVD